MTRKIRFAATALVAVCSSSMACNDDARIKTGMSEADVHRLLGKSFIQTRDRKVMERYFLPADCLPRAVKADLYNRFMGARFAVAYDEKGTVACAMGSIVD